MPALLGTKIGMTQLFIEDGVIERVTVVQAGPCRVTGLRTEDRDGYTAVQLGFGDVPERKLTKAALGHLGKSGDAPLRHLREFRGEGEGLEVGQELTVDVFEKGQKGKVSGVSKGKGFPGTVKRHRFSRATGSIGASATPSRVFKGIRGPGQMGNNRVTQRGLEIVDVIADQNLVLLRGSVPGPKGSVVEIRTDN